MNVSDVRSNATALTKNTRLRWCSLAIKRVFDIVVSLLGLVILSPVFAMIAFAIKRDTQGPAFYHGRRTGQEGKEFQIIKFRTMYEVPESYSGPKVTASDDERITPFGRWLRDTKLNELPQLLNVLKGDMSLVGPRPEDSDITRSWPEDVFQEVLSVRPGITSPASVLYRNEETLLCADDWWRKYLDDISPDKRRLDELYVRYRSFVLDLDIIFWTFLILVPRLRTFSPPETLLFVGPFTRLIHRYVNWFIIDLFITIFSYSLIGVIWRSYSPLNLGWPKVIVLTVGIALLFSIIEALWGANSIAWSQATFADFYNLLIAWFISATIVVCLTIEVGGFPMKMVVSASLLAVFGLFIVRYRSRLMIELISWILRYQNAGERLRERVIIIGTNQAGQHAAWLLSHPANARKFWVVGFVDNELLHQGLRFYGAKVIGMVKDVPQLMEKFGASLVLLADHQEYKQEYQSISAVCAQFAVKLVVLPDILATLNGLANRSAPATDSNPPEGLEPSKLAFDPASFVPQTGSSGTTTYDCESNPCLHCLIHNDTYQLSVQLGQLTERIDAGDLEGVRAYIRFMRESIGE